MRRAVVAASRPASRTGTEHLTESAVRARSASQIRCSREVRIRSISVPALPADLSPSHKRIDSAFWLPVSSRRSDCLFNDVAACSKDDEANEIRGPCRRRELAIGRPPSDSNRFLELETNHSPGQVPKLKERQSQIILQSRRLRFRAHRREESQMAYQWPQPLRSPGLAIACRQVEEVVARRRSSSLSASPRISER